MLGQGEHGLDMMIQGGPGGELGRGRVRGMEFSARVLMDKVAGAGMTCSVGEQVVAMGGLGLSVQVAGSGSPVLQLTRGVPEGARELR